MVKITMDFKVECGMESKKLEKIRNLVVKT